MIAMADELLGIGLYTPDEAARYARLTTSTIARWIHGTATAQPVVTAQLPGQPERFVTFLDFIQALAVRAVRVGVRTFPLQKLRKAHDKAQLDYGVKYPLAAEHHRVRIFGPLDEPKKCEAVIDVGLDDVGQPVYKLLTGQTAENLMITPIAEPFMRRLTFEDGLPAEYLAWQEGERKIIMNPHYRLGEPFLPSCGYTAHALFEACQSEGGIERAARAYGVEQEDVELVYNYYDYLLGTDAA